MTDEPKTRPSGANLKETIMTTATEKPDMSYFGLCPECKSEPVFRNVGRSHWAHCASCRTKWCIGDNLFSDWRRQSEVDWQANSVFLSEYREVMPYHTPEDRRETIASRGMFCLQTDDEAAAHEAKRRKLIEEHTQILHGSGGWYVIQMPGKYADIGGDAVDIIHGPLESKEAAEFARKDAMLSIEQDGHPCVGSEVPAEDWNIRGRLLRFLRDNEGKAPEDLADSLVATTPWVKYDRENTGETDIPF